MADTPAYLPTWRIGLAGVTMIGVSYGFARYGYGLFAPTLRDTFSLSVAQLGVIGSAGYVGYLTSLVLVGWWASWLGPRRLVIIAGVSGTVGMAAIAAAPNAAVLTAGLVVAGSASGWAWAPYSDAVDVMVAPRHRQRVMGLIPSGTAFGVTVAGPAVMLAGAHWRAAWWAFAVITALVTWYNAVSLSDGTVGTAVRPGWKRLVRPGIGALFVTAASYGVVGAVYWTFAGEVVGGNIGLRSVPWLWTVMGCFGILGVFAGIAIARWGLRPFHTGLLGSMALAVFLIGVAPGFASVAFLSAALYGPAFMVGSSVLAMWSYRVYPDLPTTGFSATVFFVGLGTAIGPAIAGPIAQRWGLPVLFVSTALLALGTLVARPTAAPPRGSTEREAWQTANAPAP